MKSIHRVLFTGAIVAALPFSMPAAYGQDDAAASDLKQDVKALRSDMAVLSAAMLKMQTNMDSQFKKVLKELAAVKKVAGSAKARTVKKPDTKIYDINIGDSPYLGAKDAAVTIVEFTDFQCPFCIREVPKLKQLVKEYPNDVKVVFKNYPLGFHKRAKPAAAAAMFAAKQKGNDAFWEMHDKIIAGGTKKLDTATLRGYAEEVGLELTSFDAMLADASKIDELLKADLAEARKCGVRGTPTVMVNGLKQQPRTIEAYKARIDKILADKKKDKT